MNDEKNPGQDSRSGRDRRRTRDRRENNNVTIMSLFHEYGVVEEREDKTRRSPSDRRLQ